MGTTADCAPDRSGAFSTLYERHVDEVRRYVQRRCGDQEMAEDVAQDVFVAVARSGEEPAEIGIGWLIRTARNRLIDQLRRRDRHAEGVLALRPPAQVDATGRVIDRIATESALSRLSGDQREVLTLHYVEGLTIPEAAERMGRTPKSVEGLVTRARRSLRESMSRELEPPAA